MEFDNLHQILRSLYEQMMPLCGDMEMCIRDSYNELFLRRNEIKTRQCVYISRDVHGKILRIVNDIAGGEISVGGYVDTVLRQHLEQHKERINELYKKQREDLI